MILRTSLLWMGIGAIQIPTLAAQAEHGKQASTGLFSLDPGVSIWALVVFALLLFLLKKFAWKPIIQALEEREKNIKESLEKAKEAQQDSLRIATEQAAILNQAKLEAAKILKESKALAEDLSQKIKAEAQLEKQRMLETGLREIEAAKKDALIQIKAQASTLAIYAAEKLIMQSLNTEDHKKLVDKLIEEID